MEKTNARFARAVYATGRGNYRFEVRQPVAT